MKSIAKLLLIFVGSFMLAGCSSSDSNIGAVPGPGIGNGNGCCGIVGNVFDDRMVWETVQRQGPSNRNALAELISVREGICWVEGEYPGHPYEYTFGNRDCFNYTDNVHLAFTYHPETERTEVFVQAWCESGVCGGGGTMFTGSIGAGLAAGPYGQIFTTGIVAEKTGAYVQYARAANPSGQYGSGLHVNFGPTYNETGRVLMDQQTYEVEIYVHMDKNQYQNSEVGETVRLDLYYGKSSLQRKVGSFDVKRLR